MEMSQAIIAALAKVRGEKVDNCKCRGSGKVECKYCHRIGCECDKRHITRAEDCCNYFEVGGLYYISCPTCATIRELDFEIVYCLHLGKESCHSTCGRYIEGCKGINVPDLTTHQEGSKLWLVHIMQVLGVWEEFVGWLCNRAWNRKERLTDTLTDSKLLVPAVEAWLKERS